MWYRKDDDDLTVLVPTDPAVLKDIEVFEDAVPGTQVVAVADRS